MTSLIRRLMIAWIGLTAACLLFVVPSQVVVHAATDSTLVVTKEQVFFLPTTNNNLQVLQQLSVQNSGKTAADLQLSLPKGATGPSVQGFKGSQIEQSGQDLVIPKGAKPGKSTEVLSYTLPFASQTSVQLTLHTAYPVYLMSIYVPIGNVALSAPGLMPDTQTTTIAGTDFRVFSHGEMSANSDWTASISMLPSVTSTQAVKGLPIIGMDSQSSSTTWEAIGNLAIAAAILVIALLGIRSTVGKNAGVGRTGIEEALLNSWEETEWAYEEGRLDESDYERRRASLRNRLVKLRQAETKKR